MKKTIAYLIGVVFIATLIGFVFYINHKLDRIVVVDVIQVFNEFNMKKELELGVEKELDRYSSRIDSLTALLELSAQKNDKPRVSVIDNELYRIKMEATRTYEISNKNINEQVWNRLNPLIKEFSEINGYRIVIGANGMGTVLYNIESVDRTSELISFINKKYETGG